MVTKGAFRAMIGLAMIFLSFNNSIGTSCCKSSYANAFSNQVESSDLFIMFSAKGKVNVVSSDNTPLWELHLFRPLVSTTINIKVIDFDELNILPGEDGRLYLIHSKSDTFKLINTTIPELVKQSPIASKYLPNVLFRGKEKKKEYTIDLEKGTIEKENENDLSLSSPVLSHHLNKRGRIEFERTDYVLQSVINYSSIAWNATLSVINITSAIPYEEYYKEYNARDYAILTQYGEHYQHIFKFVARNKKVLRMSDQMKGEITSDDLLPHNKNESHPYALCFIIVLIVVISVVFAIGLSMKAKASNKQPEIALPIVCPHKKKTEDTGSEDAISQLSTGSRITGNKNKLKRRNSFSYKDISCHMTMRDRNEKDNPINKLKDKENNKEDFYELFHRESAPEYSIPLNNNSSALNKSNKEEDNYSHKDDNRQLNRNSSIKQKESLNGEESNEEELSPNKIYTMKKISQVLVVDKPKSAPPIQLDNIAEKAYRTYSNSRKTSGSFVNSKKKYVLSEEEKAKLKKLNTKYLQDIKKSSSSLICKIDECKTTSRKYSQIYRIINNSSSESDEQKEEKQAEDNQLLDEMIQSARFSQMCDTGRFIANFKEIQLIGKGGFGSVFKAMHKIDDCYYAIKIIKFSVGIEEDVSKINEVQEIKTMMKVEHKNIVRYITCWFEFKDPNRMNTKKVRSLSMEDAPITKTKTKKSIGFKNPKSSNNQLSEFELVIKDTDCPFQKSKDYESIIFENNKEKLHDAYKDYDNGKEKEEEDGIIFASSDDSNESIDSNEQLNEDDCSFNQNSNKNSEIIDIDKQKKKITLTYPVYFYMQMEYCEGFPLSYYLENRTTTVAEGLIVHIFRQIATAVQHIHNKKIIHRDLKPANIFIHNQFTVKIGDFGLAAEIDQSHREKVGTFLYQSPEQVEGKVYNEKVDIYALGLILLEMCLFFGTESERRITLMNIRKMVYPEETSLINFKAEMSLAKKMTNKNPCIRPSISDVINSKEMKKMIEKI